MRNKVVLKINLFGLSEKSMVSIATLNGCKDGACLKITHSQLLLSAVPNLSLKIGILSNCSICKSFNLNIHKYLLKHESM